MGLSLLQQPRETHPHPSNFPYPHQPRKRASLPSPYPPSNAGRQQAFPYPPANQSGHDPPLWQPETAASLFPSPSVQLLAKTATLRQYFEKLNVFWTKISESECRPPERAEPQASKIANSIQNTWSHNHKLSHNHLAQPTLLLPVFRFSNCWPTVAKYPLS